MAALGHLRRLSGQIFSKIQSSVLQVSPKRWSGVYTDSGALNPKPDQTALAALKLMAVVFPFLYAGATISKSGAAFLEENDIFVPDDDDD